MATSTTYFNQFLDVKPTLDELCEHIKVNMKWYKFGLLLKLDTTKLEAIRMMNEDRKLKENEQK